MPRGRIQLFAKIVLKRVLSILTRVGVLWAAGPPGLPIRQRHYISILKKKVTQHSSHPKITIREMNTITEENDIKKFPYKPFKAFGNPERS